MGLAEQAGYRPYTNGEAARPGQAHSLRDAVAERFERLEARVAELEKLLRNVTHVTAQPERNVTRNGNAERQRRYRERKKALGGETT